jgi:hypothetical protein
MRAMLIVAGLTAGALAPMSAHAAPFDGNWSVEVITEKGDCDRAYRYPVIIQNGRARYGGPESFNVSGSVAGNGAIQGSISRGQDRATVSGRLSGNNGSGTWTASGGSRTCSGRWNADKRG